MARKYTSSHDGELLQVLRRAIDIGADIEQHGRIAGCGGKDAGECRAIDTGNGAQHDLRRRHGCAGIARGHEPMGGPSRTRRRPTRMELSRLARIASTLSSMVMTFDGMDNFDGQAGASRAMAVQFGPDDISGPDQRTAKPNDVRPVSRPQFLAWGRVRIPSRPARSTLGMVCRASWLLQRRGLRVPYSNRISGRHDAAFSSRDSWGIQKVNGPSRAS